MSKTKSQKSKKNNASQNSVSKVSQIAKAIYKINQESREKAIAELNKVLVQQKKNPLLIHNLGLQFYQSVNYHLALECFEK